MMRKLLTAALLPLVLTCSVPAACFADGGADDTAAPLQVGPVIVNPSLTLKESWTDNVFGVADGAKSDLVTTIAPSLLLRLPFRAHELSLGARADIATYAEYSSEDVAPWQIAALGNFVVGDRFTLKVGDTYQRGYETALESTTGFVEENSANAATLSAKYAFVDVAQARLDYAHRTLRFSDVDDYRSRDEDLVSAYLYYRVLPNTSAFLEYDLWKVAYTEDSGQALDNDGQGGYVGATWEIQERSQGTVKVGYQSKNFKESGQKDASTWAAAVELKHELTELTSVRILGGREVNEGKYRGTRFYTTTGFFAEVSHKVLDRLTGLVNAGYGVDSFSDANPGDAEAREDTTFRAGVGARYSFRSWLDCGLNYRYFNRDSNIDRYSVQENVVTFEITARR